MGVCGEVTATAVTALALILCVTAIADPRWQVSDPDHLISEDAYRYVGLWTDCEIAVGGAWICEDFDKIFLGQPAYMQGGRAFSILGAIFSFLASMLCLITISNVPCTTPNFAKRNRLRIIGCVMSILSALCMIIAGAWFAKATADQYYGTQYLNAGNNRARTEVLIYGEGIFIAFVAGVAGLVGAVVGMCVSCGQEDESSYPTYRPPVAKKHDAEYV